MSFTYVVPDIHGRLDLLNDALAKIERNPPGAVVFLGDYVDRGPDSAGVISRLMAGPTVSGWKWICLKGNHEDMMLQALADESKMPWWGGNGGVQTAQSYGWREGEALDVRGLIPVDHLRWIEALPVCHADPDRIYVHAGLDHGTPLSWQTQDTLLWKRYAYGEEGLFFGRHVVHGHTPHERGPKLHVGRTNLDTGAVYFGRLVVGIFRDDTPGSFVDSITCVIKPR